jgi:hypothetical protein
MNSRADAAVPRPDRADIPGTSAMIAGILTPHACPARCGAQRLNVTAKSDRHRACPAIQASPRPAVQRRAGPPSGHTSLQRRRTFTAATAAELSIHCSPSIRGFSPPSTVLAAIGAERKLRQLKPSGADPPAQIPEPRATPPGAVRYRALPARSTQDRSVSGRELGIDGAHGVVRGGGLGDVAH